jgi:signal transduction histidine kinase
VASNQRIRRPSFVYSAHLFPTELNAGNASIKVIFPTMKKEQLSSNKGIWSSVIIVVLVFLIFVFSTYTIFRQRNVSQMKTDFMNNMTHELKTPMASISLASQMLQDPNVSKTPERITSLSKIIDNESRRLQVMFEKILQLSVYEKGESHLKLTDLSVNELVNSVCDTFEISVSHVGGQLIRQLDAQFDIALVDKLHFTGIIYNLLDNAVKYRSPDRPLIVYVRTSSNQEGTIQIIVEDNGLGISRSDQKRIFDRFFRVHTGDRHDVKGYGIGLTYVKHMVDMHHGTISVSSELGIGTRFTISLPVL